MTKTQLIEALKKEELRTPNHIKKQTDDHREMVINIVKAELDKNKVKIPARYDRDCYEYTHEMDDGTEIELYVWLDYYIPRYPAPDDKEEFEIYKARRKDNNELFPVDKLNWEDVKDKCL